MFYAASQAEDVLPSHFSVLLLFNFGFICSERLIFSQRSVSRSITSPKPQNFGEKEAGLFSVRAVLLLA